MKINNGATLSVSRQAPSELTEEACQKLDFIEVGKVVDGVIEMTNKMQYQPKPKPFVFLNEDRVFNTVKRVASK